jgi:AcrR family transcriptional regulator
LVVYNSVIKATETETGHAARRRRDKAWRRQAILEATIAIARESGWGAVSVRKIAGAVEYSTIVIYDLFGSKEDLFVELKDLGFRRLLQQYRETELDEGDPAAAVLQLSHSSVRFFRENRELYQLMFGVLGVQGVRTSCLPDSASMAANSLVRDYLEQALEGDSDSLFLNWWALVHGFISIGMTLESEAFELMIGHLDTALRRFLGIV